MDLIPAFISTFGLAFFWFIGAIPAGVALRLPLSLAVLTAWLSYTAGVGLIILIGAPLRAHIIKRFNLSLEQDPKRLFWRAWGRFGLIGLGALAPITVGAQVGALIGLALGVSPARLLLALGLGAAGWGVLIGLMIALGLSVITG